MAFKSKLPVGQRVRSTVPMPNLPVGSLGTVTKGFGDLFGVNFDADDPRTSRLIHDHQDVIDLVEPVEQEESA